MRYEKYCDKMLLHDICVQINDTNILVTIEKPLGNLLVRSHFHNIFHTDIAKIRAQYKVPSIR